MEQLFNLIDLKLMILIIVSSYWAKKHLLFVLPKISIAIKIFFWSTLISAAYFHLGKILGFIDKENFVDLIITYFVATSFYELFFQPLEKWITKLAKSNND